MAEATTQFYLDAPTQTVATGTAQIVYRRFGSGPLKTIWLASAGAARR